MPDNLFTDNSLNPVNATGIFRTSPKNSAPGGMSSSLESPPIECHILASDSWTQKQCSPGKSIFKIGSTSSDCDLCIPGSSQDSKPAAILRLLYTQWYLIETGAGGNMIVNGLKRPQAIIKRGTGYIISIGTACFVLLSPKDPAAKPEQEDPEKTIRIKLKDGTFVKLSSETPALVGSSSLCHINVHGMATFSGAIFPMMRKPHLYSIESETSSIKLDGKDSSDTPLRIRNNASATFSGTPIFTAEIPLALDEEVAQKLSPGAGHMMLLDISGNRTGQKLILPASGRSIFIGRDPDNHFTIESANVSRRHAQLIMYDTGVLVLDCRSTNGTFVEGERVSKKMLHTGETVQFGDKLYFLCHTD